MKRWLCAALAALFVAFSFVSASALNTAYQSMCGFCDDSGMYRISCDGARAEIKRVVPDGRSAQLRLSYPICGTAACEGRIVLFCNDAENRQLIVYTYDLEQDNLDSFCVYGMLICGDTDFCCDRDYIYIEDSGSVGVVRVFSQSGRQVQTCRFDDDICDMLVSYDGRALALSGDTLYAVSAGGATAFSGSAASPLFPVKGAYLASVYGDIYQLSGGDLRYCFSADSDKRTMCACISDGILYYPCGSRVFGYSIDSGEKICAYDLNGSVSMLYADGDALAAAYPGSFDVRFIDSDAFTDLRKTEEPPDDHSGNTSGGKSNDRAIDAGISSDTYRVDLSGYIISDIAPDTTIAQFKARMKYDGYSVRFYHGSIEKMSGNVGTAMTAAFENVSEIITFALSVIGDLTGEGSCNSRDLVCLMDHLIGSADLSGVYLLSADLHEDKIIDAADLAVLKRLIA